MNDNNSGNKYDSDAAGEVMSWVIVLILMFAFWPLGLVILLRKLGAYSKKSKRPAKGRKNSAYAFNSAEQSKDKKPGRTPLDKKSGKFISAILLLISITLFILGGSTVVRETGNLIAGSGSFANLGMGIFYLIGGFISFFSRNINIRRIRRYKKYNTLIGGRAVVPVADIADAAGVSEKAALRDIQAMIDAGYLGPDAYIDYGLMAVALSAEAAEDARTVMKRAREAAKSPKTEDIPENQYMAIINELRDLNSTIADIPISDKIDRIEETTAKIFRTVEENPAKLPQIRRFMNYYLPTTLKLLHTYATLEKQGVKGQNITATKQSIGDILDKLSVGFVQQLDMLFKDDAIDISSDINVLERMMQQDGLSGTAAEFRTMEGGGI